MIDIWCPRRLSYCSAANKTNWTKNYANNKNEVHIR